VRLDPFRPKTLGQAKKVINSKLQSLSTLSREKSRNRSQASRVKAI
jgi:hypothetical protein